MVETSEKSKEHFFEYFKTSKLLKVGLAFNLIYYLCIIFGYFFYLSQGRLHETIYTLDFQVFYEAGQIYLSSPGDIYTVIPNGLPFRYLPSFAIFMSLVIRVPIPILYVANITIMMILNFGIVYSVYEVCLHIGVTPSTKNFEKTLLFVFIAPQHIINIILGQITQLAILLVLFALTLLLTSPDDSFSHFILIGFLIGIASTLKPFFLILIPFLVPVTFLDRTRFSLPIRNLVCVVSGLFLSLLPNIVYFFSYPAAFDEFLQVNLSEGLSFHHSTSVTRLVTSLLPFFDTEFLQLGIILILGGFIFLRSYIRFVQVPKKNYLHHFADMMFLILLVYPDSWFLFLAIWYAFMGPSMLQLYHSSVILEKDTRTLDILWSGANNLLAFFFFGIILYYLFLGIDPINPIWLIILYFLYHRVFRNVESSFDL